MASATAKFDFRAEGPEELSVNRGDKLKVIGAQTQDGWVLCRLDAGPIARQGLVPFTYLTITTDTGSPAVPSFRVAPAAPSQQPSASVVRPSAPVVASAPATSNVAVEHAECPVCYDSMSPKTSGRSEAQQQEDVSPLFPHGMCAVHVVFGSQELPVCRQSYSTVFLVPNYDQDALAWFKCVDFDGNGKLNRAEVQEILKAICPVDWRRLESRAEELWARWDRNGDNELSFDEICNPRTGLLAFVKSTFAPGAAAANGPPPTLEPSKKKDWFAYFDEDFSNSLEQEEVTRALIKTFNLSSDLSQLEEIRHTVSAIWPLFDLDGSGSIDLDEFCSPDGLGTP